MLRNAERLKLRGILRVSTGDSAFLPKQMSALITLGDGRAWFNPPAVSINEIRGYATLK